MSKVAHCVFFFNSKITDKKKIIVWNSAAQNKMNFSLQFSSTL